MLTTPAPHGVAARGRVHDVPDQREPNRSDDFADTSFGPQWHWQANPHPDWARLPGDGTLHLAVQAVDRGNLRELPCVLAQQLPGRPSEVTTSLSLESDAPGARTGLVVLGLDYAWIGLEQGVAGLHLVCRRKGTADAEDSMAAPTVLRRSLDSPRSGPPASVRATTDVTGLVRFSWSIDGRTTWHRVGLPFQAAAGQWIGAEIGLFACAPVEAGGQRGEDLQGSAVFRAVEFTVKPASDAARPASDEGTS